MDIEFPSPHHSSGASKGCIVYNKNCVSDAPIMKQRNTLHPPNLSSCRDPPPIDARHANTYLYIIRSPNQDLNRRDKHIRMNRRKMLKKIIFL